MTCGSARASERVAYLLDINVLIARSDPWHEFHAPVKEWLGEAAGESLLLCPTAENAFLRILGHPDYPDGPGTPARALDALAALRRLPGAAFIPEDVSISDRTLFNDISTVTSRQLTDVYLLGLAVSRGAKLVTTDRRIPAHVVRTGPQALVVIRP